MENERNRIFLFACVCVILHAFGVPVCVCMWLYMCIISFYNHIIHATTFLCSLIKYYVCDSMVDKWKTSQHRFLCTTYNSFISVGIFGHGEWAWIKAGRQALINGHASNAFNFSNSWKRTRTHFSSYLLADSAICRVSREMNTWLLYSVRMNRW